MKLTSNAMERNIHIGYLLTILKNSIFFLGVWVFYYLRYTNYQGIGLIETFMIFTLVMSEIPTGALADLIGKKKTLLIAFFLISTGNIIMAVAPNFSVLVASVIIMTLGGSFYSGTFDALIFDSLKQIGHEDNYASILSKNSSLGLITFAFASITGGYMYNINVSLPFFTYGFAALIGTITCLMIQEPKIDTQKMSFSNYINQIRQGFLQLTKAGNYTLLLRFLAVAIFGVIGYEMLNDIMLVDLGFTSTQLGFLIAGMGIAGAVGAFFAPRLINSKDTFLPLFILGLLSAVSYLISPWVSLWLGALVIIFRLTINIIFDNNVNARINHLSESKYRATTLSTYSLLKSSLYICLATSIGKLADDWGSAQLAHRLGIVMLLTVLLTFYVTRKKSPFVKGSEVRIP